MRYVFFPTQDASIYSEFSSRNTGLDEILDVGKTDHGSYVARSLLQFDLNVTTLPPSAEFDLVLRVADAKELQANQRIEICQVSQSWTEGTGYYYQETISTDDGATWTQRSSGSSWPTGSQGGSVTGLNTTSSVGVPVTDMTFDVTDIVRSWISGSSNYGVLVKYPDADEANAINRGSLKFFSKDTHTIYKPTLVAKWVDQVYITGSSPWPTVDLMVTPSTLKPEYRQNELVRVDLSVRERYPTKTFDTVGSIYSGQKYLPSSSYYSIIDEQSGTVIVPFGADTAISSNGDSSYFTFRIQNMYPLRYYRVLLKVEHDGLEEIFDDHYIFTVK